MCSQTIITDETLTAWLDGDLEDREAQHVSQRVAEDADLQNRAIALRIDRAALLAELDTLLAHAPPMVLPAGAHAQGEQPATAPAQGRPALWRLAAALALGGVLGAGIMAARPVEENLRWVDMAAYYQVLYVHETLAVVNDTPEQAAEQMQRVSEAVGRDLSGAQAATTLEYRRGQILGYEGVPIIQLAYLSGDGVPVALCLTQSGKPDTTFQTSVLHGMPAVEWIADGYHYVLLGHLATDRMIAAAMELAGLV